MVTPLSKTNKILNTYEQIKSNAQDFVKEESRFPTSDLYLYRWLNKTPHPANQLGNVIMSPVYIFGGLFFLFGSIHTSRVLNEKRLIWEGPNGHVSKIKEIRSSLHPLVAENLSLVATTIPKMIKGQWMEAQFNTRLCIGIICSVAILIAGVTLSSISLIGAGIIGFLAITTFKFIRVLTHEPYDRKLLKATSEALRTCVKSSIE